MLDPVWPILTLASCWILCDLGSSVTHSDSCIMLDPVWPWILCDPFQLLHHVGSCVTLDLLWPILALASCGILCDLGSSVTHSDSCVLLDPLWPWILCDPFRLRHLHHVGSSVTHSDSSIMLNPLWPILTKKYLLLGLTQIQVKKWGTCTMSSTWLSYHSCPVLSCPTLSYVPLHTLDSFIYQTKLHHAHFYGTESSGPLSWEHRPSLYWKSCNPSKRVRPYADLHECLIYTHKQTEVKRNYKLRNSTLIFLLQS